MAGRRLVVKRGTQGRPQVALARNQRRIKIIHRVRPGDTLWSIAARYRVYVSQLERWNVLNSHGVLRLGQRILIWASPAMLPAAMAKARISE
jgi:spore germination protein YaaH